eukprot:179886_1
MAEQKQNTKYGFIEWKVNGNLMEKFKNAKHKQVFYSPQFETIDGTIWRICFYPHGRQSPDDCSIRLQCVKLNSPNKPMGVCYSFNIREVDWCYDHGATFENDGQEWVRNKIFKADILNDLERMSDFQELLCLNLQQLMVFAIIFTNHHTFSHVINLPISN